MSKEKVIITYPADVCVTDEQVARLQNMAILKDFDVIVTDSGGRWEFPERQPTLRDRFAMSALNGLINIDDSISDGIAKRTVEKAYKMADMMVKQRKEKE